MDKEKRISYLKEYREQCGDVMREQSKEWQKLHPGYWHKWRQNHLEHRQKYEREYYHRRPKTKSQITHSPKKLVLDNWLNFNNFTM
jgi:hypothetical protein